jgi:NAD(P)-dependent dehydrogenase (short-subunit alcohol dehydrogenase family)
MSLNISLAGQRALVTGASSGLGPSIARSLDAAGAEVVIHYHSNEEGARSLSSTLTNQSVICRADLGQPHEVSTLFQNATNNGPVSILVNCAAVESQQLADLGEMDTDRWSATMQANVAAPLLLTRLFARQSIPGAVINISSIEGSRPAPGHGHYAASKAALEMLTQTAALELGPAGIRVNAIAPGLIWREGIEEGWPEGTAAWKAAAPLGALVRPEDIGSAVAFLASGLASSVTGTVLTVDAGLSVKPGW